MRREGVSHTEYTHASGARRAVPRPLRHAPHRRPQAQLVIRAVAAIAVAQQNLVAGLRISCRVRRLAESTARCALVLVVVVVVVVIVVVRA